MRPIAKLFTTVAGALVAATLAAAAPAHADDGRRGYHGDRGYQHDVKRHDGGRHDGGRRYGPRYDHRYAAGPPWRYGAPWHGYRVGHAGHYYYRPPVYRTAPGGLVIVIRP